MATLVGVCVWEGVGLKNCLNIEKCDDDVCVFPLLCDVYLYMCTVRMDQIFTSNG